MINRLHQDIPIYLDKLRMNPKTKSADDMIRYINGKYPQLEETYTKL